MRLKKEERARRHAFIEEAFITETDDCIFWPWSKTKGGYPMIGIGSTDKFYVTRLICERAYGPPPTPRHDAAHNCNNPPCINKRHLRWDTRKGNMEDTLLYGTRIRGEKISHSVLTEDQVREIRASSKLHQTLADEYGVSRAHITQIINRKRWGWLS